MTPKTKAWLIAILYVLFIYLTLGYVRTPVQFLRSHGLLVHSLTALTTLVIAIVIMGFLRRPPFSRPRFLGMIAIFLLYFLVSQYMSQPEEQIHFFQYGLVGIFFVRALSLSGGLNWKSFGLAMVLASLAGWIDELIQGVLPNRYYDLRDVFLNIISAALGLGIYFLFPSKKLKK